MITAGRDDEIKTAVGLLVGGGALVFSGVRRMLKARRLEDTARSRIAHAPQGNVEIEGFAWSLKEPFCNTAGSYCAYYSCKLEEELGSGKNRYWKTRWSFNHSDAFVSLDQTGGVVVFHKDAEVETDTCVLLWSDLLNTKNGSEISKFVQTEYGAVSTGWLSNKFRLVEDFITLGSPCYVQGNLSSANMAGIKVTDGHISAFFEYLKRRPPGEVHRNLRFDQDRDGKVTHLEASGSMHSVAKNILKLELGSISDFVARKPGAKSPQQMTSDLPKIYGRLDCDSDAKLIIASMHEHHFLHRVSSSNLLRIFGGAVLIAFGLVYLVDVLKNGRM